ncbi:MAG TPA: Na-translocating system protein MpsC family protein [Thermoleophilaceae bacterium]
MTERVRIPEAEIADGDLLAEISRSLVQLHKECYGKGPTKARTYLAGDLVVCLLEGGFTAGERTLREHGREDAVVASREAFQDALRDRFVETVEHLMHRRVVSFISGLDPATETSSELFVLADDEPADDEHAALRGWGSQARRQARTLVDEQTALRRQQAAVRTESARARRERSG